MSPKRETLVISDDVVNDEEVGTCCCLMILNCSPFFHSRGCASPPLHYGNDRCFCLVHDGSACCASDSSCLLSSLPNHLLYLIMQGSDGYGNWSGSLSSKAACIFGCPSFWALVWTVSMWLEPYFLSMQRNCLVNFSSRTM